MEQAQLRRIIEGLLFLSHESLSITRLREIVPEVDAQMLRELVEQLNTQYRHADHAFQIQEVAGGYQLVTDPELSPWMKRLLQLPREHLLSKAALETLAIIAYRQPITKAEIETIRGVDGTATLETLLERQFATVVGRRDSPGRPLLYGTTQEFLRHFGLKDVKDLPPMSSATTPVPGFGEVLSELPVSTPQDEPAGTAQPD